MNPTSNRFFAILEEIADLLTKSARYLIASISTMSWPTLLAACIALALAIVVLPLALTLFVVLVAAKLIIGAIADRRARGKLTPYKPVDEHAADEHAAGDKGE